MLLAYEGLTFGKEHIMKESNILQMVENLLKI